MKSLRAQLICCLLFSCSVAAFADPLPTAVAEILTRAQLPLDSVSIVVKEAGTREPILAYNADKAMNPASVIKLVTTYAGLELLGPAYTWKSEVLAAGEIRGNTLYGDLILKGGGDPKLTVERFWLLLRQLRERGLTTIRGDLILDRSAFEPSTHDPAKFDGEPLKAYNVGPDPLLLNFKTVRFSFAPSSDGKAVAVTPDIKPIQLEIVNRVKLGNGLCGEWADRIALDVQTVSPTQLKVSFTGTYPRSCGERTWNIALLDHARFVGGAFAQMWRDLGGRWTGAVKIAPTPADARLLATAESPPLADVVRDINKYSNNVMARQLFLALSLPSSLDPGKEPASAARSMQIVRDWLAKKNIAAPELSIENGAGLSRTDRVSAGTLTQLLDAAWKSSVMPEFISSLALYGVDGTFRRRSTGVGVVGQAHMKSGTLNDVRAMAGFVLDANGRRWIVAMLVQHPNAGLAAPAQDALLAWVQAGAPSTAVPTIGAK